MKILLGSASAAALLFMIAAPVQAAVTFGSAQVVSNASANANSGSPTNPGNGFGTDTESLSSYGPSVMATASAQADSYSGMNLAGSGSALEESSAMFTSAASGTLDLSGITSATSNTAAGTGDAYSEGQSATYNFSVDSASVLTLSYNYTESFTQPDFTNGYGILNTATGAFVTIVSPAGANASGSHDFNLAAGTYSLFANTQLGDYAYAADGAPLVAGNHEELYTFNIVSAAPEPASWALMMLGVGTLGLALRARRRVSLA